MATSYPAAIHQSSRQRAHTYSLGQTSQTEPLISVDESIPRRTVRFQCGLFRETETFLGEDVKILCKETLLEYICDLLTLRFPEHPYGDLTSKIILMKHTKENTVEPLKDSDEIENGSIIEIILQVSAKQEDTNICAHILQVQSYRGPTFCDFCGQIMVGLVRQGLKCDGCGLNCHKRCAINIPNNCTRSKTSDGAGGGTFGRRKKDMWSGRPLWVDRALKDKPELPHTFAVKSYPVPTQCFHCKRVMKGLFRQGMQCKDCKVNCHKRCSKEIGKNCLGEMLYFRSDLPWNGTLPRIGTPIICNPVVEEPEKEDTEGHSSEGSITSVTSDVQSSGGDTSGKGALKNNTKQVFVTIEKKEHTPPEVAMEMDEKEEPEEDSGSCIPVQRLVVTLQYSKQQSASTLMEGWMVHYTSRCPIRKRFYWKLDTKCLSMYTSDSLSVLHQEVLLSEMLAVDPPVEDPSVYSLTPPHIFEIVTSSQTTYFCGIDIDLTKTAAKSIQVIASGTIADRNEPNILRNFEGMSQEGLERIGVGSAIGVQWGEALHNALMPMTPAMSLSSLSDVGYPAVPVGGFPNSFRSSKKNSNRGSLRGSIHRNNQRSSVYNQVRTHGGSMYGHREQHSSSRTPHGSQYGLVNWTHQGSQYGARSTQGSSRPRGSFRGSFRVPKGGEHTPGLEKPPGLSQAGELKPVVETTMDIGLFYQIHPDEVLGSGQFGTVYGGVHRSTGHPVAVKVIDKLRFPNKHENALKHEVAILQHLSHPGIVSLEQMFETPEKIYVVMEKMHGDMLELILSSPDSKLSERITKFFVYQILTALRYLHTKDVVHCDLKPENVLLASSNPLPLIKLCDFGFARIIGENHFRKSIVGTPAYLAPEVLKNQGYNRSLDLWSVGVIIYVSLSGTFPFNEDEEIADQIQNAAFMFPPEPWKDLSREAIDLIKSLLQLEKRRRHQVSKSLNHPWLQEKQLYEDLRALERRENNRFLTHDGLDKYWSNRTATSVPNQPPEAMANGKTAPSQAKHSVTLTKSALEKTDDEIEMTEARAKKIGYKISEI